MNRIKVKFTNRELLIFISFLEQVTPKKPQTHNEKLVATCLAEMLHKLKMHSVLVKDCYTIQLQRTWGHALVHFCMSNSFRSVSQYKVLVNRLISLIDQKTA